MSSYDELVGDTLAMVNVVRQAFGKEALSELPDARTGDASDCLYYRALGDIGVKSVNGQHINFASERIASVVGTLWGTQHGGGVVRVPRQFSQVIGAFDGKELPHYNAPRRS